MHRRRWLNQSQPQTLVIACFLLYLNAAFTVLSLLGGGIPRLSGVGAAYVAIVIGGGVAGGYGIANERKWGYLLGVATAIAPFVLQFLVFHNPFGGVGVIGLVFEIALVALLLHTQSREYQKVWFK